MAWMTNAALAIAARTTKRSAGSLLVRSISRVEFRSGSEVSDHLIFRPRLNAVFDRGRSAEVEVQVSKRSITTGDETKINVGYFHVSSSDVGNETEFPFEPRKIRRSSIISDQLRVTTRDAALSRRRLLLARQQLLGGIGKAVEWHPTLHNIAPIFTILSVLRLVKHSDSSVCWQEVNVNRGENADAVKIEWTSGEAWGRSDTISIRAKAVLTRGSPSLASMLQILKTKRTEWDMLCESIDVLEEQSPEESNENQWDIVKQRQQTATGSIVPVCYLRSWTTDLAREMLVIASQSVVHPGADENSLGSVLPSGWFARKLKDGEVELTYIMEQNFVGIREVYLNKSDIEIVEILAGWINGLFEKLSSYDHH